MLGLSQNPQEKSTLLFTSLTLILIQIMFGPQLGVVDAHPNFMLLLACVWGLSRGSKSGVIAGFLSGIIYDLLVSTPFGLMTFALSLAGFLSGIIQRNVIASEPRFALVILFGLSILVEFIVGIFIVIFGFDGNIIYALFGRMIASALYTTLCAFPLFYILRKFISDNSVSQLGTRYK